MKIQDNFVFVDTESNINQVSEKEQILTFKLGCGIFWNKTTKEIVKKTYFRVNEFWNDLEARFTKENRSVIMFAHNTQFDFKMLEGFNQLFKRDWKLESHYIKNKTFILIFKKRLDNGKFLILHIWDTMNYVPKKLEIIGESVGFSKLSVDFESVSDKELEIYCQRDTEIVFQFVKKLVEFLEINDLSRLKATAGSLSFNTFRHRFYNPKDNSEKICVHNWKRAIKLERESYKGGITDCFKLGTYNDLYKVDINSMYPSIMEAQLLPIKLVFNSHESNRNQENLFNIYRTSLKEGYGVIAKVKITIPKENAYILNNFGNGKSVFAYGSFIVSLCNPELEFIEQNGGSIDYIYHINVYEMKIIFKEFVEFFYSVRTKAKELNNKVDNEFCKLMLNTQYGKWGQKQIDYIKLDISHDFIKQYQEIIILMIERAIERTGIITFDKEICYLGTIVNEGELYIVNSELYLLKQTEINSYDTFVAIPSFITSYARMMLINYLKIAKRENVYYCDTDSLVINQEGYDNLYLANKIHDSKLGALKIEAEGQGSFYAPKFYDFNDERKCKGIKLGSKLISENSNKAIYQVELWQKFKTDLKEGNTSSQVIRTSKKEINKVYNKGIIDKNNCVVPFSVKQIIEICS